MAYVWATNKEFCFLSQLAGAAILGIGIWTEIDPGQFDAFLGNSGYALPAKILIAAGAFVMVVGFLGCCGAIKESRPLLGAVCTSLQVSTVAFDITAFWLICDPT